MGARHMTLGDFYADNGFGQASGRGRVSFPEFATHNTKLQELYNLGVDADGAEVAIIVGQLDLARIYQEQGQHLQTAEALSQADALLNRALTQHAPGGRKWVIALIAVLAVIAVVWAMRRSKRSTPLRINRKRKRRRKALPAPRDDDDDDDDDDADGLGGGLDDEEDDDA